MLAIHYAGYVGVFDVISYLLQIFPNCVKLKTEDGSLPLIAASVNYRCNLPMIKMIYEAYPEAVAISDNEGALPIHKAAQFAPLDVIQFLHKVYPEVCD